MNASLLTTAGAVLVGAAFLNAQNVVTPARPDPVWESCEEMHDTYVARFDSSIGFGLSRMARPQMLDRAGTVDLGQTKYSIQSIELIGLLNRPAPVVYVPLMHGATVDSKTAQSRPLTDFEQDSLSAFRGGKGIASTPEKSGTMRCMGALHANESCLRCHKDKKAGDMLGAFTYELRPRG
jgi:hypothetical protein